jgi:hypothetical protein
MKIFEIFLGKNKRVHTLENVASRTRLDAQGRTDEGGAWGVTPPCFGKFCFFLVEKMKFSC